MQNSRMVSPWVTKQGVRRVAGLGPVPVQGLHEGRDPVVDIGAGFTLAEPVEEVAVGVPEFLLVLDVPGDLEVRPVLLAQPGLFDDPFREADPRFSASRVW